MACVTINVSEVTEPPTKPPTEPTFEQYLPYIAVGGALMLAFAILSQRR